LSRLPEPLERALERAATIVTADPRQAFNVRLAWSERQRALGRTAWPSPDVLPLSSWLARTWARSMAGHSRSEQSTLLTRSQEQMLWEKVVADSGAHRDLLHPFGAARAAQRAWYRIHDWAIDRRALESAPSAETRAFLSWAEHADRRMREQGCLDPARALWRCPVPAASTESNELLLLGFDVESPSIRELRSRLAAGGLTVSRAADRTPRTGGARLALENCEAEALAAARWARRRLERNPGDRLLIAVPDLAQRRGQIERTLADVLDPAALLSPDSRSRGIFALEASQPLDRFPIIATALTAFELAVQPVAFDAASDWLRSPYLLAGESAATLRARLDIAMRPRSAEALDMRSLAALLGSASRAADPDRWPAALADCAARFAIGLRTPAQWTGIFSAALDAIGWPGDRPLDSAEHQTVEKFHDALREFAMLDRLLGRLDPPAAVRAFRQLVAQTAFQPETGDTAVTVTSRLDDPVLDYNGIWVCGLHAGAWPEAPNPDPFIPWPLQAAAGLPEATAAGTLECGRRVLASWLASSAEVIVSWPGRLDDEECDPSPLIATLPDAAERIELAAFRHYAQAIHAAARREPLPDEAPPPPAFAANDFADARTLTLQSLCPFRAFAEKRLRADTVEQPQPGIDARTRGQFMHRALEQLGRALDESAKLRRMSPEQRTALLDAALHTARAAVLERPRRWSRATLDLETARLRDLLHNWLEVEAARAPFRTIAVEESVGCSIAAIPFRLRIDRIDALDDGRRLLIDYKSGRASTRRWFGERPEDPQMPLYAVAVSTPPQALAYAVLNADGCQLEGISTAPQIAQGIAVIPDWSTQFDGWRRTIERLAGEFAGGHAAVDPTPEACGSCHLHSLCRIHELRARAEAAPDDE
jgi:probable DNA repair protein